MVEVKVEKATRWNKKTQKMDIPISLSYFFCELNHDYVIKLSREHSEYKWIHVNEIMKGAKYLETLGIVPYVIHSLALPEVQAQILSYEGGPSPMETVAGSIFSILVF